MFYVVNNHLNNLSEISNKAVLRAWKKNPKLISVGLTFIPEPRVSPILEFEDQI